MVFFLNRLTQKRGFLHETGFLSTVESSTTAIRGPRNRGKVGDKLTNIQMSWLFTIYTGKLVGLPLGSV